MTITASHFGPSRAPCARLQPEPRIGQPFDTGLKWAAEIDAYLDPHVSGTFLRVGREICEKGVSYRRLGMADKTFHSGQNNRQPNASNFYGDDPCQRFYDGQ